MAKGLEYYMSLPYRIELIMDSDEEGYAALIPELRGCITVGRTISDAITNIEDAKKAWLSSAIENDVRYLSRRIQRGFQIENAKITSQEACGALMGRRNKHEPVLHHAPFSERFGIASFSILRRHRPCLRVQPISHPLPCSV